MDENRSEQVEEIMTLVPHVVVVHPRQAEGNLGLYALLGGIFRRTASADFLHNDFLLVQTALADAVGNHPRQTVLYPLWREPWMTVRQDAYIASML